MPLVRGERGPNVTPMSNEEKALATLVQLVYGRYCVWLSRADPAQLITPSCIRCQGKRVSVHRSNRKPILDYRCKSCKKVFNCWSGTVFRGSHRRASELLRFVALVIERTPTKRIGVELGWNRPWLVTLRRRVESMPEIPRLRAAVTGRASQVNGLWPSDLRKLARKLSGTNTPNEENASSELGGAPAP